jgi:hypothetical protein
MRFAKACPTCGQSYLGAHVCSGPRFASTICSTCGQSYTGTHVCPMRFAKTCPTCGQSYRGSGAHFCRAF